jgi:hypothetical protein
MAGIFETLRSPRKTPRSSPRRQHDAESKAIARRQQQQQQQAKAAPALQKADSRPTGARGFLRDRAGLTRSGMGNLSGTSRKTVTAIPGSPAHLTQTSAVERQTGNGHAKLSESSVGRARSRSRDQQREHASLQASIGTARPARRSPGARNFLGRTSSLQEDSGCRSTAGLAERSTENSVVLMTTMAI